MARFADSTSSMARACRAAAAHRHEHVVESAHRRGAEDALREEEALEPGAALSWQLCGHVFGQPRGIHDAVLGHVLHSKLRAWDIDAVERFGPELAKRRTNRFSPRADMDGGAQRPRVVK